jgi:putative ABC transport system ATP-binding protein
MIRLRSVEKAFAYGPAKTYVLRRIDLDIEAGEFVSIMGPSGAGKSTLLHILGMHDQSWAGEYYFDDVAVHALDTKKRAALRNRNIGFVFQSYHLLDDQTVIENLELP